MVQYSEYFLSKQIGPNVIGFSSVEIPDMSGVFSQAEYWVANYFLSNLTSSYRMPMHAYCRLFLTRVSFAYEIYDQARLKTIEFVDGGAQSPSTYSAAISRWEVFLGQTWHALETLAKAWDGRVHEPKDGSKEFKLHELYNAIKHAEDRIKEGHLKEDDVSVVWFDGNGLTSRKISMSYQEASEILYELGVYADALQNPATAIKTLEDAGL
ncbi:MAG: hypothetical protein AAGL99_01970 [Pseudomonadota bacterium]